MFRRDVNAHRVGRAFLCFRCCCLFCFAAGLTTLDLTTKTEKAEVESFFRDAVKRLNPSDRKIPQILRIRGLLKRGIGVHHAGLLPIIKEVVEMMFARSLVKVLRPASQPASQCETVCAKEQSRAHTHGVRSRRCVSNAARGRVWPCVRRCSSPPRRSPWASTCPPRRYVRLNVQCGTPPSCNSAHQDGTCHASVAHLCLVVVCACVCGGAIGREAMVAFLCK